MLTVAAVGSRGRSAGCVQSVAYQLCTLSVCICGRGGGCGGPAVSWGPLVAAAEAGSGICVDEQLAVWQVCVKRTCERTPLCALRCPQVEHVHVEVGTTWSHMVPSSCNTNFTVVITQKHAHSHTRDHVCCTSGANVLGACMCTMGSCHVQACGSHALFSLSCRTAMRR